MRVLVDVGNGVAFLIGVGGAVVFGRRARDAVRRRVGS